MKTPVLTQSIKIYCHMRAYVFLIVFILLSIPSQSQSPALEDCKKEQLREKDFILKNKITEIEVKTYEKVQDMTTKKKSWVLIGRDLFEYDVNANLISRSLISVDLKGIEKVRWQGTYRYSTAGVCDSITVDQWKTGTLRKCNTASEMYPVCYQGKKTLVNGLTLIRGKEQKLVYTFK
jgi:hypothetical protein